MHPIWCYLFVYRWDYGVQGAGIASTVSNLIICVVIIGYTNYLPDIRKAVFMPDMASCLTGLQAYVSYGVPSTLMLCSEWWACDSITVLTGYFGPKY
mmetsp:Transcript_8103/g.12475  ORF Transcript_8103/g.12475 Transcript_8103/m.12475 type:complete len:97 (-) Transcript_8103:726-1016(-)